MMGLRHNNSGVSGDGSDDEDNIRNIFNNGGDYGDLLVMVTDLVTIIWIKGIKLVGSLCFFMVFFFFFLGGGITKNVGWNV